MFTRCVTWLPAVTRVQLRRRSPSPPPISLCCPLTLSSELDAPEARRPRACRCHLAYLASACPCLPPRSHPTAEPPHTRPTPCLFLPPFLPSRVSALSVKMAPPPAPGEETDSPRESAGAQFGAWTRTTSNRAPPSSVCPHFAIRPLTRHPSLTGAFADDAAADFLSEVEKLAEVRWRVGRAE